MVLFKNLTKLENEALLKFPAYMSLLAANADGVLDEIEKKAAIKFSHTKTFSCEPLLEEFYLQADKIFAKNITQIDNALPKEKNKREIVLKRELFSLQKLVLKLGADYTLAMHKSMKSFKDHVSRAHHNIFVDFIFPLPIPGLTK
jgi:hypothetical protein